MNMDFAALRTELSPGVRAREEVVRPMRGHKTYSHGVLTFNTQSRRTCNEVWMVLIARNLVRSLWSSGLVHAEEDHE